MAIFKNGLIVVALLVTLHILETRIVCELPSSVSPVLEDDAPQARVRRDAPDDQQKYLVEIVVNTTDQEVVEKILSLVNTSSLPLRLSNNTKMTDLDITAVCVPAGTGFQCRCQEGFAWPRSSCVTYGACHENSSVCRCINAIPVDGSVCLPVADLLTRADYEVEVEMSVTDVATIDQLRNLINDGNFSLTLSPTANLTSIEIATVCSLNGTGLECRCEAGFYWSGHLCRTYGACDDIIDDECGCISSLPSPGQYCQPRTEIFEYEIIMDVLNADVEQLRNSLRLLTFPLRISPVVNITAADVTTVCSHNDTQVQCRCEKDFRWPCDQCLKYGACDDFTNDTCGCLESIPTDGQYCRPTGDQNFPVCPTTTVAPSTSPTANTTMSSTEETDSIPSTAVSTTAPTTLSTNNTTLNSTAEPALTLNTSTYSTTETVNTTMDSTAEPDFNTSTGFSTTSPTTVSTSNSITEMNTTVDVNTTTPLTTSVTSPTYNTTTYSTAEPALTFNTTTYSTAETVNTTMDSTAEPDFTSTGVSTTSSTTESTINTTILSTAEPVVTLNSTTYSTAETTPLTTSVTSPTFNTTTYSTAEPDSIPSTAVSTTAPTTVSTNNTTMDSTAEPDFTSTGVSTTSPTTESTINTTMDSTAEPDFTSTGVSTTSPTTESTINTTILSTAEPVVTLNSTTYSTAETTPLTTSVTSPTFNTTTYSTAEPDSIPSTAVSTTAPTTVSTTNTTMDSTAEPDFTSTGVSTTSPTTESTINTTMDSTAEPDFTSTGVSTTSPTTESTINTTILSTAEPVVTLNSTTYSTAETTPLTTSVTSPTFNTTTYSTAEPDSIPSTAVSTTAPTTVSTTNTTMDSTAEPEPDFTSTGVSTTSPTTESTINTTMDSTAEPVLSFNTTTYSTAETTPLTTSVTNSIPSTAVSTTAPTTLSTNSIPSTVVSTTAPTTLSTNSIPSTAVSTTAPTTLSTNSIPSTAVSTTAPTTLSTNSIPSTAVSTTAPTTLSTNSIPSTAVSTTAPTTLSTNSITSTAVSTTAPTTLSTIHTTMDSTAEPDTTLDYSTVATTLPNMTTAKTTSVSTIRTQTATVTNSSPSYSSTSTMLTTRETSPSPDKTTATAATTSAETTGSSVTPTDTLSTAASSTTIPTTITTSASDSPTTLRKTSPLIEMTTISTSTVSLPSLTTSVITESTTDHVTTPPVGATATAPPTTVTTLEASPHPPASTAAVPVFEVQMTMELDKSFTPDLNDPSSEGHKALVSEIKSVLVVNYGRIQGFVDVSVTRLREGSIIADFVVKATQVNAEEMEKANKDLPEAMETIAAIIGNVSAEYNSSTPIRIPILTYTGRTLTLNCGPPPANLDVGPISSSTWRFNNRDIAETGRYRVTSGNGMSVLTVTNVILADVGLYTCTLHGKVLSFAQQGLVNADNIQQAPVVRLQSQINVKCEVSSKTRLVCCVQSNYRVKWFQGTDSIDFTASTEGRSYCVSHDYLMQTCIQPETLRFTCRVDDPTGYEATTTLSIFLTAYTCNNNQFGSGQVNDVSEIGCDEGQQGRKTAVCESTGEWRIVEDSCILTEIKDILIDSEDLVEEEVPQLITNLNNAVNNDKTEVSNSTATVAAIVEILGNIANVSTSVSEIAMQEVLETVEVLVSDEAIQSWVVLNENATLNASSALLGSLEVLADQLVGEFTISTEKIILERTLFSNAFFADLNSTVTVNITGSDIQNASITTMMLSTFSNIMPVRNTSSVPNMFNAANTTVSDSVNAAVILLNLNETINNVVLSYQKLNDSLSLNPQCVFWNFLTFGGLGSWDDKGCSFVSDINNTVTCTCNHLTSFSILMSPDIPESIRELLDLITYIGVGISMASLLICLVIEAYVWKAVTRNSTSYMRHVSIVNTAVSLLTANICFIIASAVAKNALENPREDLEVPLGPCSTATFFMHFSYLALFFWMLVSGLLLFYRTVMVFSHMSKSTMLGIGFTLGYGCPLLIAAITVAVTAPVHGYIRKESACWLNWTETKALLALVVPALTVVLVNILIIIVVLFKMLRRGLGETAQGDEKHALFVVARCVIILTPLFGLTWSLGVGTMVSPTNKGIHIAFAFFNSLQGFFILVFGTLLDSRIRSRLARQTPSSGQGSDQAKSSGHGTLSQLFNRLRGRRYIYRVSEAANTSSNVGTESIANI